MKTQAFLYIRFSTKRQEQGDSVERQVQTAEKWCAQNNCELSSLTFEDLGVSAFKEGGKRPALGDLIQAIEQGKIPRDSYLLIEDHDRLSRRGWRVTQNLVHQLVELGVRLVMTKSGTIYDSGNIDNIADNIVLMLSAERAFQESERKSVLIKAARKSARKARKVTGKLPMWIKRDGDGFAFNERTECIRKLVDLKLNGVSNQSISKRLNEAGYTTSTGAAWSASGVVAITSNHALYGAKAYFDTTNGRMNKDPIEIVSDIFPALIPHTDFLQINKKMKKGGTSKRSPYSRLLKCGNCGAALTLRTSNYNNQKRSYRACVRALEGSCDQSQRIREPEIYLDEVLAKLKYESTTSTYVSRTSEFQAQLETLEKTKQLLIQMGDVDALADVFKSIKEVKELVDISKAQDEAQSDPESEFKDIISIEDVTEKNAQLRRLLAGIHFHCMVSRKNGTSVWKVIVEQINGVNISFMLDQKYGFGNTEIKFVANLALHLEEYKEPEPEY